MAGSGSTARLDPASSRPCEPVHGEPPVAADQAGVQLATVRGITVHTSLAGQLEALLAAAEADGLHLTGWGYRSHERQIELRREHCGTSQYAVYEMPSSQCSPPTARWCPLAPMSSSCVDADVVGGGCCRVCITEGGPDGPR